MNRPAFLLGLGLASLALAPLFVKAQAPPAAQSPHGDLAGDCATCHTSEGWSPLRSPLPFDHRGTGFPLAAAHGQVGCRSCHQSLVFSQVPTACADCHRDAHRGEMGPNCETCHAPESWTNRNEAFRIHSRTRFPLLGPHAGLDCESCHRGAQPREYTGLSPDCVSCHRPDYQSANNPNHVRLGFPQQCESCHSPAARAWSGGTFGASFPHPATFPLTGAHARVSCAECHANGRFAGTPTQCVSCHRDDYDRAQPNHRASGFPTTCQDCHGTSQWEGATFNHPFPLTRDHAGIPCATCHTNPGNFRVFECTQCHRRNEMDDEHDDVRGYQYNSPACYSCHPNGRE